MKRGFENAGPMEAGGHQYHVFNEDGQYSHSTIGNANQEQPHVLQKEDALYYLDQVKTQFASMPSVYNRFLDIMKDFKEEHVDTPGVIQRVSQLFKGHHDLIIGFNTFLPPGYKIEIKPPSQPVELNHAISYVNKIKTRFAHQPQIYKAFLEILHSYQNEQEVFERGGGSVRSSTIREVYDHVASLFRHHPDLLDEFTHFLPQPHNQMIQEHHARAMAAQQQGKRQRTEQTQRQPRQMRLSDMSAQGSYEELHFFDKVQRRLANRGLYEEFLKTLHLYSMNVVNKQELVSLARDTLGKHADLFDWFKKWIGFKDVLDMNEDERASLLGEEGRMAGRPLLHQIDYSSCRHLGPSYRELPKMYQSIKCSGRTDLCHQVLNNVWVSVPTGSEGVGEGFKFSLHNPYEVALFRVEDMRFELDMMIERNAQTIRVLEPLARKLETGQIAGNRVRLSNVLNVIHLRSIGRVYGEPGTEVVDLLKRNPAVALPVVLMRLKEKDDEWRRAQRMWNVGWAAEVAKNAQRALDRRSYNFRNREHKKWSTKNLVAEAKDRLLLYHQGEIANKQFSYDMSERWVHDVLFRIIRETVGSKYSSPTEQTRLINFLDTWVARFLGLEEFPKELALLGGDAPLHVAMAIAEAEEAAKLAAKQVEDAGLPPIDLLDDSDAPVRPMHVFFCDTPFYVFLRLYEVMFERILMKDVRNKVLEQKKEELIAKKKEEEEKKGDDGAVPMEEGQEVALLPPGMDWEEMGKYEKLLISHVNNEIDQQAYEDGIHNLDFGEDGYVLVTMNRVVSQLLRALHQMVSSDFMAKMIAMHTYERARGMEREGVLDEATYAANAVAIAQGTACYRVGLTPKGVLEVRFMDARIPSRGSHSHKDRWHRYLTDYSTTNTPFMDVCENRLLLVRNVLRTAVLKEESDDEEDGKKRVVQEPDYDRLPKPLIIHNNLEMKIARRVYHVFYVAGTEDLYYRVGCRFAADKWAKKIPQRSKKWRTLLQERLGDNPLPQTLEECVETQKPGEETTKVPEPME